MPVLLNARVRALEFHLPEQTLTTEQLEAECPDWQARKVDAMTGIEERHLAAPGECASDLAVAVARTVFESGACRPDEIDFLLFCTQTPDYLLPTTACLIQDRLGLRKNIGAFDFNLGSSGYVYGLGTAKGLIESGQARNVLLLTGDTYSRLVNPRDRSVRPVFGDAATATVLGSQEGGDPSIGPFVYGTDGSGGTNLMVPAGGMRTPRTSETSVAVEDANGNVRSPENLAMNGGEIFEFTLGSVPKMVNELLERAGKRAEDVDLFVFHQANRYMLDHLRKKMKLPAEKVYISIRHGNTTSSSIPVALKKAVLEGKVSAGTLMMLVGFGPGYSWGATLLRWTS
jgi:3-oxoacyl-[acyl-carrier-protein] synthase-3